MAHTARQYLSAASLLAGIATFAGGFTTSQIFNLDVTTPDIATHDLNSRLGIILSVATLLFVTSLLTAILVQVALHSYDDTTPLDGDGYTRTVVRGILFFCGLLLAAGFSLVFAAIHVKGQYSISSITSRALQGVGIAGNVVTFMSALSMLVVSYTFHGRKGN
jgi:MFS family permease